MSPRTLARRFRQEAGTTPHRWMAYQRLLSAQRRLETTRGSIDEIAEAVGFGTASTLRQHFQRAFGTTPTAYRRRFSMTWASSFHAAMEAACTMLLIAEP